MGRLAPFVFAGRPLRVESGLRPLRGRPSAGGRPPGGAGPGHLAYPEICAKCRKYRSGLLRVGASCGLSPRCSMSPVSAYQRVGAPGPGAVGPSAQRERIWRACVLVVCALLYNIIYYTPIDRVRYACQKYRVGCGSIHISTSLRNGSSLLGLGRLVSANSAKFADSSSSLQIYFGLDTFAYHVGSADSEPG
eukprot:scaffold68394_cov72-Phaeocystis_antarctica.AAC.1